MRRTDARVEPFQSRFFARPFFSHCTRTVVLGGSAGGIDGGQFGCDVSHDGGHGLGFHVAFFALGDVFGRHAAF